MSLFDRRRRSASQVHSSGHAGDDETLGQIAQRSDLTQARHWVHYLYFAHEAAARAAAVEVGTAGWAIQTVAESAEGPPEWVVIAGRDKAITNAETVRSAREFFEAVARSHAGGYYDGWEASVSASGRPSR